MVGVYEVPEYAWYSHNRAGEESTRGTLRRRDPSRPALRDNGGASGDDWISGAQSMRAYMRGAQVAGIMAEHLRSLGWSARSHTNSDSEVLHIPLVLEAGLGEMSRIGKLVLNPFVGPRFKPVVLTTDMPLTPDKKIDFGLQDFCNKRTKCARDCPGGAIPFGDKIMFNGSINPIRKWWWDLGHKDGRALVPEKGTNARDLGSRRWSHRRQAEGRPLPA